LIHTLAQHDSLVTGIDWGRTTNRLLSCSQDRNAYVWTYDGKNWNPTLVILRLEKGCTVCQWSPKEDKFAIGSAAKAISICYYDDKHNWWVSKLIKELESTVVTLSWHNNNVLLASGGTDSIVKVHSTFIKNIDSRQSVAAGTPFGNKLPFAKLLASFPMNSWVEAIDWSPSGNQLAWATHDSNVHFLECSTTNHQHQSIKTKDLPFSDLKFLTEDTVIAVGHDCTPVKFQGSPLNWQYLGPIDQGSTAGGKSGGGAKKMFQDLSSKGTSDESITETELKTKHQNGIRAVSIYSAKAYSTIGNDGQLIIWNA